MLTGAPTAASCARARRVSILSRRFAHWRCSTKDWGSSLPSRARRNSSWSNWSSAQVRASSSRAPPPAVSSSRPQTSRVEGAFAARPRPCAAGGMPSASGTRAGRWAARAP
eukprot:2791478-Alexandrium_andersonii.AAC.1